MDPFIGVENLVHLETASGLAEQGEVRWVGWKLKGNEIKRRSVPVGLPRPFWYISIRLGERSGEERCMQEQWWRKVFKPKLDEIIQEKQLEDRAVQWKLKTLHHLKASKMRC